MQNKPKSSLPSKHLSLRPTLTAVAAAVVLGSVAVDAHALALGALTVRSALGEPLRAEIEVPQITKQEAETLRASIASPAAFRAAGVEYLPVMSGVRVSLQRSSSGRSYLRLTSSAPINEPFVGVVIDANTSSGRVTRDYTMLLDPPEMRQPAEVAVTPAQVPTTRVPVSPPGGEVAIVTPPPVEAPGAAAPHVAPLEPMVTTEPTARRERVRPQASTAEATEAKPRATRKGRRGARTIQGEGGQVTVQRGDTAGRIAAANKAGNVSLDQMLVAMLRANPDAFINGNVNRMRAGAVLDMPTAEQAAAVPRREARRAVIAQSRDFNGYRNKLARSAPRTQVAAADRRSSGRVQTEVATPSGTAAPADKLTLSKGGIASPASREAQIAQQRQTKEQTDRVAELSRNLDELSRLNAASGAAGSTPAGRASAAGGGITVPVRPPASGPAPAPVVVPPTTASAASAAASAVAPAIVAASAAVDAASSAASAATAAASAVVSTPAPRPRVTTTPPPPPPEPSFLSGLAENPLLLGAGALLLGGLGYLGYSRSRKKKSLTPAGDADSGLLESKLQPDSFFGVSGGQRVDTKEGAASGALSSMAYSPSQLDAAGDVDPVAEADVYLAYGRDLQAEEILKEALRINPSRIAIHRKLLEIYSKRRDAKAFETVASDVHKLTNGQGEDWGKVQELGLALDPTNPLYQPGGRPAAVSTPSRAPAPVFGQSTLPSPDEVDLPTAEPSSLDLDLNIPVDGQTTAPVPPTMTMPPAVAPVSPPTVPPAPAEPLPVQPTTAPTPAHGPSGTTAAATAVGVAAGAAGLAAAATAEAKRSEPAPLDFDMDFNLDDSKSATPAPVTAPAPAEASTQGGMLDFDMSSLNIDPDSRSHEMDAQDSLMPDGDEDPLETKLSLAREFHAIGDVDGARALVREVVAEGTGAVKARAERFLAELS